MFYNMLLSLGKCNPNILMLFFLLILSGNKYLFCNSDEFFDSPHVFLLISSVIALVCSSCDFVSSLSNSNIIGSYTRYRIHFCHSNTTKFTDIRVYLDTHFANLMFYY